MTVQTSRPGRPGLAPNWPERKGHLRLAAIVVCSLVTGCSDPSTATLDNYLTRLQRTLGASIAAPKYDRPPAPPKVAELRIALDSDSIDGLDFLALSDCALEITVGKSNSSLGKLAEPSQRLLLELEFLYHAPDCIRQLRGDERPALADQLERAVQTKREQLDARIFNATLGGDEFRRFWRSPQRLGDYPANISAEVLTALNGLGNAIEAWRAGDYLRDHDRLERWLGMIRTGDGGSLDAALLQQTTALKLATAELEQRPPCLAGSANDTGKILLTVVSKFFAGEIQPRAADLARRRYALDDALTLLETRLSSAAPESWRRWRAARDQRLERGALAPGRHARVVAAALSDCGLAPGTAD